MLHADSLGVPQNAYDNLTTYIFESVWPNYTTAGDVAKSLNTYYFSANARKNMNTLMEETTEVNISKKGQ